jgi:Bax protein
MNNYSAHTDHQTGKGDPDSRFAMHFGKRQVQPWTVYAVLGILTLVLFILVTSLSNTYQSNLQYSATSGKPDEVSLAPVKPGETANLISKLKYYGLWKLPATGKVPPFFIKTYPEDFHTIDDISVRKRVFLHTLLPHALFVRQEALQRREKLQTILNKIECSLENLDFTKGGEYESHCSWADFLAEDEVHFIRNLCRRYRTTSVEGLLERVDAVPTSIILAQGALESSWGGSRFAREGNSIFGMWTWKTSGIIPSRRDEGKTHKVKAYESILDSVRAYHLTLNRFEPYDHFRQLRLQTDDPLILVDGLLPYSERGEDYVEEIKHIILSNELQKYDNCSLKDINLPGFSGPVSNKISPSKPGKASL